MSEVTQRGIKKTGTPVTDYKFLLFSSFPTLSKSAKLNIKLIISQSQLWSNFDPVDSQTWLYRTVLSHNVGFWILYIKKKKNQESNSIPFLQIATQIDFRLLKVSKGDGNWESNEHCSIRKAIYFKHFVQTSLISQGKTSYDFEEPSEEVSRVALNRDTSLMPKLMEGSWPFSR